MTSFKDNHYNPNKIYPTQKDFNTIIQAKKTYDAAPNLSQLPNSANPAEMARTLIKHEHTYFIRYLIVGIIIGWETLVECFKIQYKHDGYSSDELKEIITEVLNNISKIDIPEETSSADTNSSSSSKADSEQSTNTQNTPSNTPTINISKGNANIPFRRIVCYNPNYNPPAAQHLLVTKKRPDGKYEVVVGGTPWSSSHDHWELPLFDSDQQAINFLNNVGNINTVRPVTQFIYNITSNPISATKVSDLSDAVLVDTICGPCYMQRNARHCEESLQTSLQEKIVKLGNKWQVQSEKGRNMGTYDTKEAAEKRLKQIEYFKHVDEGIVSNEDEIINGPEAKILGKIITEGFKIYSQEKTYPTAQDYTAVTTLYGQYTEKDASEKISTQLQKILEDDINRYIRLFAACIILDYKPLTRFFIANFKLRGYDDSDIKFVMQNILNNINKIELPQTEESKKEKAEFFNIEQAFRDISGEQDIFNGEGYFLDGIYEAWARKVADKYFDGDIDKLDEICEHENCFNPKKAKYMLELSPQEYLKARPGDIIWVTIFGKPCRIQRLNSFRCWWDFYDDPYNSTIKVFDTKDESTDFFNKLKNGQNADYTQTNLHKVLPEIHAELSKTFNINPDSVEVPTKWFYENSGFWKAPASPHCGFLGWWLNTAAEPEFGDQWYAVDHGRVDRYYHPYESSCFNAIFEISGVK